MSIPTMLKIYSAVGHSEIWHHRRWGLVMWDAFGPVAGKFCATAGRYMSHAGDLSAGSAASTAPSCWAVRSVTWYTTHCWSTHKILPVLQEIQQRWKFVALLQKSVKGVIHSHGIQLDRTVTTGRGRSTTCQLPWEENLCLYVLLWKTGNMKEQLSGKWMMSSNLHLCQGQQCSVLYERRWFQTSRGTEELRLAPKHLGRPLSLELCCL